jgi:hypothetical protein
MLSYAQASEEEPRYLIRNDNVSADCADSEGELTG